MFQLQVWLELWGDTNNLNEPLELCTLNWINNAIGEWLDFVVLETVFPDHTLRQMVIAVWAQAGVIFIWVPVPL